MYKGKMSSWLFGTMFNKKTDLMVPFFTKDTFSKRMTFVTCGLSHTYGGDLKVWMQLVIFILRKLPFNIQPNLQALTQWAAAMETTMAALAMALVVWVAWPMALVPAMALDVIVVMALATSAPLSSERPDHSLGTQCLSNFHYLILQRCYHHALAAFQIGRCPHLWWMIWMLYQDVVNCSAKWSNLSSFSFCGISKLAFEYILFWWTLNIKLHFLQSFQNTKYLFFLKF